jgi:hypothetical protein
MTDTRRKRSAALNFGPVPVVLPDADGSISVEDRAHLAGGYYIAADGSIRPFPPVARIARTDFVSRTAQFV